MAKFNWKQFAGNFLQETAMNIRERKEGAKAYEEEQRQLAERNLQLVRQREAVARNAARVGKQAMDLGASKELVINAMSSGVSGVTDLYNNLQNLHSQLGYRPGQELTEDEIRSSINPQVERYVPEISINNISFSRGGPQEHVLNININYIFANTNEEDSISLKFEQQFANQP